MTVMIQKWFTLTQTRPSSGAQTDRRTWQVPEPHLKDARLGVHVEQRVVSLPVAITVDGDVAAEPRRHHVSWEGQNGR